MTKAQSCYGRKVQYRSDWAWKVIDSEKAGGYSPLDFPPLGRFVLGLFETERERGRSSV